MKITRHCTNCKQSGHDRKTFGNNANQLVEGQQEHKMDEDSDADDELD